jgi:hypothetical protein
MRTKKENNDRKIVDQRNQADENNYRMDLACVAINNSYNGSIDLKRVSVVAEKKSTNRKYGSADEHESL